MGPPLTESPGRCRDHELGRAGSPSGANTTARCDERVLKRKTETGHGIGCRSDVRCSWRASGAPGVALPVKPQTCTTTRKPRPLPPGQRHVDSRSTLQGQVTTATPFAPQWSGPGGPRETVVDDKRGKPSSGRQPSAANTARLKMAIACPENCGEVHLFVRTLAERGAMRA
jgi:hypothetical protein